MNFDALLAHPGFVRLGWTLVYSVPQGIAIALVVAIGLSLGRKASPQVRYLMGLGAMVLMLAAPMATFCLIRPIATQPPEMRQIGRGLTQLVETVQSYRTVDIDITAGAGRGTTPRTDASFSSRWRESFAERAQTSLPWIVLAWTLGVFVLSVRQAVSWGTVQQLRRRWIRPAPAEWEAAIQDIARRLGVARRVRVVSSMVIDVPSLIGWLKPVILLPASALSGLPPGQIESILAHELAHVRRHDYLVNMVQTVIETLMFYHPAVWWVSRRVRIERELCCDDLVVATTGNVRTYALALTRMEELRMESSDYAIALTGGTLMERVKRLIGLKEGETQSGRWLPGMMTVVALAFAIGCSMLMGPSTAVGAAGDGIGDDVRSHPGYVDFEKIGLPKDREPSTEVMLNKTLLGIGATAVGESMDAQIRELIDGIDLRLVHVVVYENLGDAAAQIGPNAKKLVDELMTKGWYAVVRVPEENVSVLMRESENRIQGAAVVVANGKELVLVNIVGDIDSNVLGQKIGTVLNQARAGELDMGGFAALIGQKGKGANAEPKLVSDGFKTTLEVESMELTNTVKGDDPALGEAKAVRFEGLDSLAVGSIRLDPGIYKARVCMMAPDADHDALLLTVGLSKASRVFRNKQGLGPSNQSVRFEVQEPGDVRVELKASETGMLLDCVEFERFRKPEPAPEPNPQPETAASGS